MSILSIPSRIAAAVAGLLAAVALAACNNGGGQPAAADGFKPVAVAPALGDVAMGSADAKVTILEYASLTCPHCRDFYKQDFPRIKAAYIDTGKAKYIYRDFPLHGSLDVLLASVARCGGPTKFYDMIGEIFGSQVEIVEAAEKGAAGPLIAQLAEKNGISHDQARTCIDYQPELKASIDKSGKEATDRGVHETPTLFINDVQLTDHTFAGVSAALDKALGVAPAAPATAAGQTPPATPASTTSPAPAKPN